MSRPNENKRLRTIWKVESSLRCCSFLSFKIWKVTLLVRTYRSTGSTCRRSDRPSVATQFQDNYTITSHLRNRFRTHMLTITVTVGPNNSKISVPNKLIEIEYRLYAISITNSNTHPTSALESFTTTYPASASNVGRTCQNSPRMIWTIRWSVP